MADIIKIAEKLNSEVTRLNNERSRLEGKTESAKAQYEKAVKAYELKYGVKLTPENLQSRYNEVFAKKMGFAEDLQSKIESIKNGEYKKDIVETDFDFEPNVSPIHAEPEKKKAGRKSKKTEVVENKDVDVLDNSELNELLASADSVLEGKADIIVPDVSNVSDSSDVVKSKDRKPLSSADIAAALKESENIVQHPVTTPSEEDIGAFTFNFGGGDTVSISDTSVSEIKEKAFGENPVSSDEVKLDESDDEVPFDMSGFGDFSSLGNAELTKESAEKIAESKANVDSFSFGGLNTEAEIETKTKEVKEDKPITPDGWDSDLGNLSFDFGNFDDILNGAGDIKFQ